MRRDLHLITSFGVVAVLAVIAFGGDAASTSADDVVYETPVAAADAYYAELFADSIFLGPCELAESDNGTACFRERGELREDAYYVFTAGRYGTDTAWWIGVLGVDDGWKIIANGVWDVYYVRITNSEGRVVFGYPNGDIDCDGSADSADAALLLQMNAGLVSPFGQFCAHQGDVYHDSVVNAVDAAVILQYDVGIIEDLPLPRPDSVG